jgi:hypothetical protein
LCVGEISTVSIADALGVELVETSRGFTCASVGSRQARSPYAVGVELVEASRGFTCASVGSRQALSPMDGSIAVGRLDLLRGRGSAARCDQRISL